MLRDSKIAFIFLEVASLPEARAFYEDVLGLPVVENQFNPPHHRHGIVKYDAGDTILALNLADRSFNPDAHEPIQTCFSGGARREATVYAELQIRGFHAPASAGAEFKDRDGHRFSIRRAETYALWRGMDDLGLEEIAYEVDSIDRSIVFYEKQLGLMRADSSGPDDVRFSTGNVRVRLLESVAGAPARHNTLLTVFYTPDVKRAASALEARGIAFPHPVRFSDIGGTVRFTDPSGHQFCLYQPSPLSLSWDSGLKLQEIMTRNIPAVARSGITGLLSKWVV